ncbi:MAG: hypothetical protein NC299_14855 [Lachnospiraceae bacterium]|nr:hypothetical protein [Lachnospiraceae bacterium]
MRKSWFKLAALILLAVLSVVNIAYLNDSCRRNNDRVYGENRDSYYKAYNKFCGAVTDEKTDRLKKEANELAAIVADGIYSTEYDPNRYTGYVFGDYALLNVEIKREMTYCITYPNTSDRIALAAHENVDFYKNLNCFFESRRNELISKMYYGRKIPEYRTTAWAESFFTYDLSSLLCVVMLIFGLSAVFSAEYESGMVQLISASGKRGITAAAKIVSAFIYCAVLSIYFTVIDLIGINIFHGIDGMNMPLYSAPMFEKTPFGFSFLGAVSVFTGLRVLALFTIALLILLFSQIFRNSITSTAVSFLALIGLIALSGTRGGILDPINMFSPSAYLKDFEVYDFFGVPIIALYAAVISQALLCAALIISISLIIRKKGGGFRVRV